MQFAGIDFHGFGLVQYPAKFAKVITRKHFSPNVQNTNTVKDEGDQSGAAARKRVICGTKIKYPFWYKIWNVIKVYKHKTLFSFRRNIGNISTLTFSLQHTAAGHPAST